MPHFSRICRQSIMVAFLALLSVACWQGSGGALSDPGERSPQTNELLSRAVEAHRRGHPFRTEQFLRQAYLEASDDLEIALDLGDTLNRLQRNEAARIHYHEFLDRHPDATEARFAGALTSIGLGRWAEAADELERVVEETPDDRMARTKLGQVLGRLDRHQDALLHLQRAAELDPGDAETQAGLGLTYKRLERFEEAIQALEKATRLDPRDVTALFTLGHCYARAGRARESQITFGRFQEASQEKEQFINEKRLFRAARAKAFELAEAGKPDKALKALLAYREQLTRFPPFQQELGIAYLRMRQSAQAMAAFEKAVEMDPSLSEAQSHLVVLYTEAGDHEKARHSRAALARPTASSPEDAPQPQ